MCYNDVVSLYPTSWVLGLIKRIRVTVRVIPYSQSILRTFYLHTKGERDDFESKQVVPNNGWDS